MNPQKRHALEEYALLAIKRTEIEALMEQLAAKILGTEPAARVARERASARGHYDRSATSLRDQVRAKFVEQSEWSMAELARALGRKTRSVGNVVYYLQAEGEIKNTGQRGHFVALKLSKR